jgi:hypothetical protein
MLTKIENVYLYLLRVLILAAATLALIAVIFGGVKALPLLTSQFSGPQASSVVRGATLREWIAEKRTEGVTAATDSSAPPTAQEQAPPKIEEAIGLLAQYDKQRLNEDLDRDGARAALLEVRTSVPDAYQTAYDDGVAQMMAQLLHSTGRPLTMDQINDLITWQGQKVKDSATAEIQRQQAEQVAAVGSLEIAGGALLAFLLVVFCFLFVKIERNLRLVHVADGRAP